MIKAIYQQYFLQFKIPGGTSRGILKTKETFFILLKDGKSVGIGECAVFRGLSYDDVPDYEEKLQWVCNNINLGLEKLLTELIHFPSIQFGLEQAFLSLKAKDPFELFPSKFTKSRDSIEINGLIWMGSKEFMMNQIIDKLEHGFKTIKLKIGAIDFETELALIKYMRSQFNANEITIRVDANGAFSPLNALEKLKRLSDYDLHSIEQPIAINQCQEMASLCKNTPLPIALDEELIGILTYNKKKELLEKINPQFIILKPSLVGGFIGTNEWIKLANDNKIDWWITSALESNIGLNAIAQYTYNLNSKLPQGLGTGSLFTNNIPSPLKVISGNLSYNNNLKWQLESLNL